MAINKGSSSIKSLFVGSEQVRQVFKGSSLVWELSGISVSQSTGTSASPLVVKGASSTLTITGVGAWTASSNASWLTLSSTSGNDDGTITATAASNVHTTSSRSAVVTVKQTSSGKTATVTIYQSADSKNESYGNVTAGTITNTTIPASGTTTNYTATAGNGSQVITYTWASDNSSAGSETKTISPSVASISATANSKGTTESGVTTVKSQAVTWSGSGSKSASGTMYIYQAANTRTLSSVYIVPYQPDSTWIVTVSSDNWNTCPASGGYVKCHGYANYTHTSGSSLNDQHITTDAALSWSTGYNSWITNHSNGGYYIANRGTTDGDARSSTATWSYGGKTSAGKTLTQQSNYPSVASYGSWEAVTSWSSWSDYDYPYADTTGAYWASCSIGSGISAAGGSATVTASAGHTVYHYKRQIRSATQYRDVNYVWTSGATWTSDNGSSQTVYDYQQVSNGTTAASDAASVSIVSNGNSRFSLSGTTLSHSTMAKNLVTDSCTVRATNASATSVYKDASVSVTNTVGNWYDNGSWGSWSDTGSAYYVGSEWEGSGSDYWVSCSIGSGITAGGGSATVTSSAGHNRNFYKSRNIATIRYMPTRRDYTSGSYDTSSRSESSARAYDSVWQRASATSDSTTLSEISDNNSRFSLSGSTLSHSSMTTNVTTDSCTVRAYNASNTGAYKDASVSVSNSYSDSGGSTSYGNVTAGAITNATIPASGGSATAYAGNGSQSWSKTAVVRTFTSGSTSTVTAASNGTNSVSPSVASITATANSKGTTMSSRNTVKSQTVTWSANGKSASGTMYIYQAANYYAGATRTISANKTSVDGTGGSVTLTCTATDSYSSGTYDVSATISTSVGSLSPTSITGSNKTVTLTIPANSGAARDITVSIDGGNSITISQPAGYSSTVKGIYVRKTSSAPNLQYNNDSYGYGSVTTSWQKITSSSEVDLWNNITGVRIATDNMELEGNYYMSIYYSGTGTTSPSLKAEHEYEIFLSPYESSSFASNPLDGYNFLDDYVRWAEDNYPDKMKNCYLYIEIGSMV